MTWQLNVVGHRANPEEEKAVLEACRSWLANMIESVDQDITTATFSGTYGFHDLLVQIKRGQEPSAEG